MFTIAVPNYSTEIKDGLSCDTKLNDRFQTVAEKSAMFFSWLRFIMKSVFVLRSNTN